MLLSPGYKILPILFCVLLFHKNNKDGKISVPVPFPKLRSTARKMSTEILPLSFVFGFFLAGVTSGATYIVNSSMILVRQTPSEYVIIKCFQIWCDCKHFLNPVLQQSYIFFIMTSDLLINIVLNGSTYGDHVLHFTVWVKLTVFFVFFPLVFCQ